MKPFITKEEIAKLSHEEQVKLFVDKFKIDLSYTPANARLQFKLLLEEVIELGVALGIIDITGVFQEVYYNNIDKINKSILMDKTDDERKNEIKEKAHILDAIVDMRFFENQILQMTSTQKSLNEAFVEVTYSNMSKLDENGNPIYSDGTKGIPAGKVMKPDSWQAPNIEWIIEKEYCLE